MPAPPQARSLDNNRPDKDKSPVDRKRPPDHTTEHRRTASWPAQLQWPPAPPPPFQFPLSVAQLSSTILCSAPWLACAGRRPSRLVVAPETHFPNSLSRRHLPTTGWPHLGIRPSPGYSDPRAVLPLRRRGRYPSGW